VDYLYWFNVCGYLHGADGQMCTENGVFSAACRRPELGSYSSSYSYSLYGWENVGAYTTGVFGPLLATVPGTGLSLTYTGGAPCDQDYTQQQQTVLAFVCDSDLSEPVIGPVQISGTPTTQGECVYTITIRTQYACPPSSGGLSAGAQAGIAIACIAVAGYFVVGCCYRRSKGHEGLTALPNHEFWTCQCCKKQHTLLEEGGEGAATGGGGYQSTGDAGTGGGQSRF